MEDGSVQATFQVRDSVVLSASNRLKASSSCACVFVFRHIMTAHPYYWVETTRVSTVAEKERICDSVPQEHMTRYKLRLRFCD